MTGAPGQRLLSATQILLAPPVPLMMLTALENV